MIRNWKTLPAALALCLASATAYAEDVVSPPNDVSSSTDVTATTDTAGGDTAGDTSSGTPGKTTCSTACGKFFGDKNKGFCNCDIACADPQFNDCCADYIPMCGALIKGTCAPAQCTGMGKTADGKEAICSCDPKCADNGNCCEGFDATKCKAPVPAGSCKDSCGGQSGDGECYCDDTCAKMGDCCADIDTFCKGQTGGDGGGSVGADTSSCTPQCTGKNCGDEDKCGGKCSGPCPTGGACDMASKTCKTGGADASTTGGSDAGATDTGVKSDTAGNTGTTGTTGTGTTSSSSGGCTANGSSNGSLGMAFGLLALMGLVVRRRRA